MIIKTKKSAALVDRQLEQVRAGAADPACLRRGGDAIFEGHARAQGPQCRARDRRAGETRAVGLGHLKAGMRQAVGELAVVGEQDQAGAVDVEPSDRVQAQPARWREPDDGRPSVCVARARDHPDGLVQRVQHPRLGARERPPVERDAAAVVDVTGVWTISSPTLTRPAAISSSAERREATPA